MSVGVAHFLMWVRYTVLKRVVMFQALCRRVMTAACLTAAAEWFRKTRWRTLLDGDRYATVKAAESGSSLHGRLCLTAVLCNSVMNVLAHVVITVLAGNGTASQHDM
jgi:hypothetical protein